MTRSNFDEKALKLFNRFEEAGIDWVLVGAQAMNLYRKEPRATMDLDIVVRKKDLRKAKRLLDEVCTNLKETQVNFHGILSRYPMRLDVDVIKSTAHELFEAALDHKVLVDGLKAVPVEGVLALKYLASVSPWRPRPKKFQDVADFITTFKDNEASLDRSLLISLASRAHAGARDEFLSFFDAVEHDRPFTL